MNDECRPGSREPDRRHPCALYLSDNDVFSGPPSKRVSSPRGDEGAGLTLHLRCHFADPPETLRLGRLQTVIPDRENTLRLKDGGARRDRTDDLMLAKHPLYQLSYGPLILRERPGELSSIRP